MSKKKDTQYCNLDHANTQVDRLRANPNRASKRQGTQRRAAASKSPPGAAISTDTPSGKKD